MKIFGIGLQKTGTTTLGDCLELLGFRRIGYDRNAAWHFRKRRFGKLKRIVDAYDAFEDEPWAHAYQWLDETYPDAKFVLTVRSDADRWFKSISAHCDRIPFNEHRRYFYGHVLPRRGRASYLSAYVRHNAEVLEYFRGRPEKLLVLCWDEGDGWGELCGFLDLPVPLADLPRSNAMPAKEYGSLTYFKVLRSLPNYYFRAFVSTFGRAVSGKPF